MALTDTEIRRSKPGEKLYKISDSGGLHLMITPTGGKLWRWKYRFDSAEKLMALGRYPDISLAEARERRDAARKRLANGIDPMVERKTEKTAVREATEHAFEKVAELWLEHWRGNKSAHHAATTASRLRANVYPVLGNRPIDEIEPMEVVQLVKAVEARGALDMAKRILQVTGMIFRYALAHGIAKRNPAAEIRPSDILKPTRQKNMARIDARELPALLRAIELYQGKHLTRLAIKMMALTFVRTSELIGARWEEFDLEAKRWMIPGMRMKMKTPHIVFLSRQAVEVLDLLRDLSGSCDLLFPGEQNRNKPMSNMTILKALERMGYKDRARFSRLGVYHSSRARLQPRAHRVATCPRPTQRRQRRVQSRPLSGATRQDDAGLGRLSGTDTARRQGVAVLRDCGIASQQLAQPKIQPIFAI